MNLRNTSNIYFVELQNLSKEQIDILLAYLYSIGYSWYVTGKDAPEHVFTTAKFLTLNNGAKAYNLAFSTVDRDKYLRNKLVDAKETNQEVIEIIYDKIIINAENINIPNL